MQSTEITGPEDMPMTCPSCGAEFGARRIYPAGLISTPEALTSDDVARIRSRWEAANYNATAEGSMTKIAIVGVGWVGKSMLRIFPDAMCFDEPQGIGTREEVNTCEIAFICVPTPSQPNGECDLGIIRDVVSWIVGPIICLKSAVPPGTVAALLAEYPTKRIVISPEYIGEGPTWDGTIADAFSSDYPSEAWPFIIAGGEQAAAMAVLNAFEEALGMEDIEYVWEENPATVELAKYMENVWLAMQVTWANEFHEVAEALGADYEDARDLWAYDPRVSASHTEVLPERGFAGKCLPKDLLAITWASRRAGYDPTFLQAIHWTNQRFRQMNEGTSP
jgi:UDPglucose 6-dehydrogenase